MYTNHTGSKSLGFWMGNVSSVRGQSQDHDLEDKKDHPRSDGHRYRAAWEQSNKFEHFLLSGLSGS